MRPALLLAVVALGTTSALFAQAPPAVSPSDFARLHAELCPSDEGKWQTIPWTIDLLAARARAKKAKKPLFMWSMNGHPLGCT